MPSTLAVVPQTHWVNGWFLRIFARPVVLVDGTEHSGRWGQPTEVHVEPGLHTVAVGARYRGTSGTLGLDEAEVDVDSGRRLLVTATNGFFNHQPFTVAVPHQT
ncbi:hypothetical protein [Brachybacterium sp. AOP3-A1-3]|uniref:hypothetical protein n=1 Tax=Brachybacterium sp. AOP3-A1-3 TaxID=3457699 RepID=UPI004033E618